MSLADASPDKHATFNSICFGLDGETDRRSLALFLARFSRPELLDCLAPRLDEAEILRVVDTLTGLMRRHLSEKEYHRLFLSDAPRP